MAGTVPTLVPASAMDGDTECALDRQVGGAARDRPASANCPGQESPGHLTSEGWSVQRGVPCRWANGRRQQCILLKEDAAGHGQPGNHAICLVPGWRVRPFHQRSSEKSRDGGLPRPGTEATVSKEWGRTVGRGRPTASLSLHPHSPFSPLRPTGRALPALTGAELPLLHPLGSRREAQSNCSGT